MSQLENILKQRSMCFATRSVLLLIVFVTMAACLPMQPQQATNEEGQARFRRRTGHLNVTSPPREYIRTLFEEYAYEDGKPKHGASRPTDVWCFPDKDVAKENFREKPLPAMKCETHSHYLFQWNSMAETILEKSLTVRSSILRTYIQVIPRHINKNESINVTVSIYLSPSNENASNSSSWTEISNSTFAGQQVITITLESNGWVELDITEGAKKIWPLISNYSEVQAVIKAEVDCISHKKVPFHFVNPAEIPLERVNRRERHLDLQPLFVVFADNEVIKSVLNRSEEVVGDTEPESNDISELFDGGSGTVKRSANPDHCSLSNYIVDLYALGLTYVLAPRTVNISKCTGSCSHTTLSRYSNLGTNHAKIMASIHIQQTAEPSFAGNPATAPCCVPTSYDVIYLVLQSSDDTVSALRGYNNFRATSCGCR